MAGFKHRVKLMLRGGFAWCFAYTPLGNVANRLAPPRLLILFGHCVEDTRYGGLLAKDMCLSQARFGLLLDRLREQDVDLGTISQLWGDLRANVGARSKVAISMDDGYRDNAEVMAPMLKERGILASVFLESRALSGEGVNWTHHLHWLFDKLGAEQASRAIVEHERDRGASSDHGSGLGQVVEEAMAVGSDIYYHVKRRLKYDVDPLVRDRVLRSLFESEGGQDRELAERLYMSWDMARGLRDAGHELGGHTQSHAILSTLDRGQQAAEIEGCARTMKLELDEQATVFAYPFGRRWDYNDETLAATQAAGYELAVTTHAGTNARDQAPLELRRVAVEEGTPLKLILAEASGGFLLLERLGLRLSE